MIFVDTSVLIDVAYDRPPWAEWSKAALGDALGRGPIVANRVVLAELVPSFASLEVLLGFVAATGLGLLHLTDAAALLAGRAHLAYRRAGGERMAILADFLIGGHAAAAGAGLLTRDRQRFAGYFPDLPLITPETHHG
jgi:hypothetical protein